MPTEYENIAKSLMSSPQGAKIFSSLDKINKITSTPAGKQLIAMVAGGGGDAIKSAAAAAMASDKDQARIILTSLLSTKDGAQLAAKIIEIVGI